MTGVTVVLPTVRERAASLASVTAAWRSLGVEPIVVWTPDDEPRSPATHGRMGRRALAAALDHDQRAPILFCEDDVLLSVHLVRWLPMIASWRQPTTLWVAGRSYYSAAARRWADVQRQAEPDLARFPVINADRVHGSLALVLPPRIARAVIAAPEPGPPAQRGLDIVVRQTLRELGEPLLVAVPNPVQHRGIPSVVSPRHQPCQSTTFARPAIEA